MKQNPSFFTKRPMESKKFLLATFAFALGVVIWAATFVGVLCKPEVAAHLVSLATMTTGLVTLVAGAGITGQSFVDLKAASLIANSNTVETRQEDVNIRISEVPDPRVIRDFEQKFRDDPSYRPIIPSEDSI